MAVSLHAPEEKQQSNLTEKELFKQAVEWEKCAQSFRYFLMNYCFLQDRAKEATIRFEMWPHLKTFTDLLLDPTCRLLIVGKARQLGISWTLCFYAYWKAKFSSNVKVLILSQGEDESKDMITKIKFIDNHMPAFIRARRDPDSTDFIGFPESEGEIRALPSTEKAGRS